MGTATTAIFNEASDKASLEKLVNECIDHMQASSIQGLLPGGASFDWHRKPARPIDWQKLRDKAREDLYSAGPPAAFDAFGAIDRALMRLGDRHSLITHRGYRRMMNPADVDKISWPEQKQRILKRVGAPGYAPSPQPMPEAKYIGEGKDILYLSVPWFSFDAPGANREAYQNLLRDALLDAAKKHVKGVVVDLSENGGGSMCPMLWGLSPLLGPGRLGMFSGTDGKMEWNVNYGQPQEIRLDSNDPANFPLLDTPVAVLSGKNTCSSGEITLLSFSGRPRTRVFGKEPTDGNSSGNGSYYPASAPGLGLHVCGSIALDRNEKGDGGPIKPDVQTSEPFQKAIAWITDGAPDLKRESAPVLYHCIPVPPTGDFIRPSANYGMTIPPAVRDALGMDPEDHTPLVFAATHLAKSLAFGMKGSGQGLLNGTIPGDDGEVYLCCDRERTMARKFDATVYSFRGEDFVQLPHAERQSVSLRPVPFSRTEEVLKAGSPQDLMRAGLQILTFRETAQELGDSPVENMMKERGHADLFRLLSELMREGRLTWENQVSGINPNPALAKIFGLDTGRAPATQSAPAPRP